MRLPPDQLRELTESWEFLARDNQLPPEGDDWDIWLSLTGRATGKTRTIVEFAHEIAWNNPGGLLFIGGRTLGDVAKKIVGHPDSGLLKTSQARNPCRVTSRNRYPVLEWQNGAYAEFHSSEEPELARGDHTVGGICDEIGTWKTVRDFEGNTTFENLGFGMRSLAAVPRPMMAIGSTPRPVALIRDLLDRGNAGNLGVRLSTGTMYDNEENLAPSYIKRMESRHRGTRLYRQEVLGELLLDIEGAILTHAVLDSLRVATAPDMARVLVGVDPALKSKKKSDATGIAVGGRGIDGHFYAMADRSCKLSPQGWGQRVVDTYHEFEADGVVAEDNVLGEAIFTIINGIDSSIRVLARTAKRKKHKRAEPILAYFERKEAHIVGEQRALEDQLVQFTPTGYAGDHSPDNADAMVWAATELMPIHGSMDWSELAAANA